MVKVGVVLVAEMGLRGGGGGCALFDPLLNLIQHCIIFISSPPPPSVVTLSPLFIFSQGSPRRKKGKKAENVCFG